MVCAWTGQMREGLPVTSRSGRAPGHEHFAVVFLPRLTFRSYVAPANSCRVLFWVGTKTSATGFGAGILCGSGADGVGCRRISRGTERGVAASPPPAFVEGKACARTPLAAEGFLYGGEDWFKEGGGGMRDLATGVRHVFCGLEGVVTGLV